MCIYIYYIHTCMYVYNMQNQQQGEEFRRKNSVRFHQEKLNLSIALELDFEELKEHA